MITGSELSPEPAQAPMLRAYVIVQVGSNVGEMFCIDKSEIFIGRAPQSDIQLIDDGVSRHHACISVEDELFYIEDTNSRNGTRVSGERVTGRRKLENGDKIQLAGKVVLRFTFGDSLDESFTRQMYDSALRDSLTQAYNKRYFTTRLDSEYKFAARHSQPLSLLVLDLDNFKAINDTHGHVAGDRVLKAFAAAMMSSVRDEDVFARYGGEEFVIISRAISQENARAFAERLRQVTRNLRIPGENDAIISFTVSIGVATAPDSACDSGVGLLSAADRALYWAKAGGRDRVAVNEPTNPDEATRP